MNIHEFLKSKLNNDIYKIITLYLTPKYMLYATNSNWNTEKQHNLFNTIQNYHQIHYNLFENNTFKVYIKCYIYNQIIEYVLLNNLSKQNPCCHNILKEIIILPFYDDKILIKIMFNVVDKKNVHQFYEFDINCVKLRRYYTVNDICNHKIDLVHIISYALNHPINNDKKFEKMYNMNNDFRKIKLYNYRILKTLNDKLLIMSKEDVQKLFLEELSLFYNKLHGLESKQSYKNENEYINGIRYGRDFFHTDNIDVE